MGEDCRQQVICYDAVGPVDDPGGAEVLVVDVEAGEERILAVSGYDADAVGDFALEVTLDRGTCDDPVEVHVEFGEFGAGYASIDNMGAAPEDSQPAAAGWGWRWRFA